MNYLNIGNVKIEKTAALAPMASVADYAYRRTAKDFGAAYLVGEMASAKGLCYSDTKTAELLTVRDAERPMAIQLFGSEPEFMAKAAHIAEKYHPDIIDINAGCPVPKVAGNGAGAALMKDERLLGRIISATVNAVQIPVTVKIRAGWDEHSINAAKCAKIAEECGAAAVAVHARTKNQLYSGTADWSIISSVKQTISIPVIGNGDVESVADCLKMYSETGCDLVMIGRGSYGRPWIFKEIRHYFETGELLSAPSDEERIAVMKKHIELLCESKGEYIGMREARSQAAFYLKGFRGAARLRADCGTLSTLADFYNLLQKLKHEEQQ